MRPRGSKQELEVRRRTAVALRKQGMGVRVVARRVGCVPSSVVRWTQAFDRRGERGLDSKPQAGGTARLTPAERKQLGKYLVKGPRAFGWRTHLWTLSRVGALIQEKFGVSYHVSHVHRLLRRIGFSAQKPERLARERDDRAIEGFRRTRWPAIKKSAPRRENHRATR